MRIHTSNDGALYVNAISMLSGGEDVNGQLYQVQAGLAHSEIKFQRGSIQASGVNGITNEVLLAILLHRTQVLDSRMPCDENKRALQALQVALDAFNERAAGRPVNSDQAVLNLDSDAPLADACSLDGDTTCEACQ